MLGPGGTMSGMYFDDARGLRQARKVTKNQGSTAFQRIRNVWNTPSIATPQKKEQEVQAAAKLLASSWMGFSESPSYHSSI